jgi:hypothetical protein
MAATCTVKLSTSGFSDISATLSVEYTGINGGRYDLPEGLGDPTPEIIEVPFGSVEKASLIYVKNMSGESMIVQLNGDAPLDEQLAHGKTIVYLAEGIPAMTGLTLTTTAPIAGADRHIEYRIAGDPA